MLDNIRVLVSEAIHRYVHRPRRAKVYQARTEPFLHTTPDGLQFKLAPGEYVDRYIAVEGIYERRFLRFFKRELPPGAVMIDIGANIGNHALYLHRDCAEVHCFEPNPRAAERLEHNVALNHAANVHVHRVGLGSKDAILNFASNIAGNLGNSGFSTASLHPGEYETIELPIRNADDAIAALSLDRIDFIKIDVEGLEEQVFEGLKGTIRQYRPLIAFEYHGQLTARSAFDHIRHCLPDYTIADMTFAADNSSALARTVYHLQHGDRLTLREVITPQQRTYESLLAIPNEHRLGAHVRRESEANR